MGDWLISALITFGMSMLQYQSQILYRLQMDFLAFVHNQDTESLIPNGPDLTYEVEDKILQYF